MTGGDCPSPHDGGEGYCPECGLLLDGTTPPAVTCSSCGTVNDDGSYCESCGQPLSVPATTPRRERTPPTGAADSRWSAIVSADRGLFDAVQAGEQGFTFPDIAEWRVELRGPLVRIGRWTGLGPRPELDLDGPPPDPGVSHEHAELARSGAGSWELRDCGSANGTYLGRRRLADGEVARVADGQRIRLGVWSRITLVRAGPGDPPRPGGAGAGRRR